MLANQLLRCNLLFFRKKKTLIYADLVGESDIGMSKTPTHWCHVCKPVCISVVSGADKLQLECKWFGNSRLKLDGFKSWKVLVCVLFVLFMICQNFSVNFNKNESKLKISDAGKAH